MAFFVGLLFVFAAFSREATSFTDIAPNASLASSSFDDYSVDGCAARSTEFGPAFIHEGAVDPTQRTADLLVPGLGRVGAMAAQWSDAMSSLMIAVTLEPRCRWSLRDVRVHVGAAGRPMPSPANFAFKQHALPDGTQRVRFSAEVASTSNGRTRPQSVVNVFLLATLGHGHDRTPAAATLVQYKLPHSPAPVCHGPPFLWPFPSFAIPWWLWAFVALKCVLISIICFVLLALAVILHFRAITRMPAVALRPRASGGWHVPSRAAFTPTFL